MRWGLAALVSIPTTAGGGTPLSPEALQALSLSSYPPDIAPPEFSGRTLDSTKVSLAALRGKVVLLNFWASWCAECRLEMPAFQRLHREFAQQGLTVLGVNARESAAAVRRYADELGLTFPIVLDPKGQIGAACGVIGIPATFLFGRDGRAVALAVGPREWASAPARAILQILLAEPAPGAGAQ